MNVTDFLEARIREDEDIALACYAESWFLDARGDWIEGLNIGAMDTNAPEFLDLQDSKHVMRHDPARVVDECVAKRRIISLSICNACEVEYQPCDHRNGTLKALASVYSDHPDYQQEWA